jgi:hypothetical protein
MVSEIKYIELKTGYNDDGPAWIGKVMIGKTGTTLYFNDKAFRKGHAPSAYRSNYYDVETGEGYWISGVKQCGARRRWAGCGKISIDRKVVPEYLQLTNQPELDGSRFEVADIQDVYPIERILRLENVKK